MKLPTSPRIQGLVAIGLLAIGGGVGAVAGHAMRPAIEMAPQHPVAIRSLPNQSGIVSIRARVAESYGNKIVLDDGSARTLVDLGRARDEQTLVRDGQTVTVQGRFDRGALHPSFLVDAAGDVHELGPIGHPPHGPDGPPPPHGPGAPAEAAPPPPPGHGGPGPQGSPRG